MASANTLRLIKLFTQKLVEDRVRFDSLPGVTPNWDSPKLVKLYSYHDDENATQEEIAEVIGCDRSTISRKMNNMDWDVFEAKLESLCAMSVREYIKESAHEYLEKTIAREASAERRKEISQVAFYENMERKLITAVKAMSVPVMPSTKISTAIRTPEHIVLMLSDLHVGLDFSSKETGFLNSYNLEVFRQRAANLKKAVIEIFALHSQLYNIPELHIFGLGDMVQGTNLGGEWGPAYISIDVMEQANIAGTIVADLISDWSRYFKKITFDGVVGNHGRGGKDKNSDKVAANWDNVAYLVLDSLLRDHKNVEVNRADAWWRKKNVNGSEFMLVHGDYFGSSSNSLQDENRKLQDLIAPLGEKPFKYLCLGHFHRHQCIETTNGEILVNGSFVGGDMYSMQQMRSGSRSTQTIMGVHPERGITWQYKLDLSSKRD